MFLFDKKTPTTKGSGGSLSGATTFMWDDAAKGDNVMYRIPRNIIWNDNVVVREDEYAGTGKCSLSLINPAGSVCHR
jgi:hypothetical protein